MKILQVHNYYQRPGGEDIVVANEYELLRDRGHQVIQYTKNNDGIGEIPAFHMLGKTIFNRETTREVDALLAREAPDVIHAHNTFPLISPALYYSAAEACVPVIQTLHNFRLLCPAAILLRNGKICEDCVGRVPYPAVLHSCYRGSRSASTATAAMLTTHRLLGTWETKVHTFVLLTNFAKLKFIEGGMDPGKLAVKPNFLASDPGAGDGSGRYALYASRLAPEKGLGVLMDAWDRLKLHIPLKIAGDGTMREWLQRRAAANPNIEVLGPRERAETIELVKRASLVIVPSECYENLPMTIVEAFACGTPVVTSWLPSMDELVTDGVEGARFETGSAADLAGKLERLWHSNDLRSRMRRAARAAYERRYTAAANYRRLMQLYEDAVGVVRAQEVAGVS